MARAALFLVLMAVLTPSLLAVETRTAENPLVQSESTSTTTEKKGLLGIASDKFKSGATVVGDALGAATAGAAKGVDKVAASAGKAVGQVRYAVSRSNDSVCYEGLGCFSLAPPWNRALVPEPDSPDDIDTRFYLYTRKSPQRFNVTTYPEVSLQGSDFQPNRRTFFITHGFSSDGNATWLSDLKDAILKKVDGNVFLTDWGNGANKGNYYQVAGNTRIVGAELARLLEHLDHLGTPSSNVHLFGHSLGSQISSYAAKERPGIARITAMDPAQPGFEGYDSKVRLDPNDAQFVDVIHTNAKPFVPLLGFGMMRPVGHVDFYMNGGADQPGCQVPKPEAIKSLGDIAKIPVSAVSQLVSCSHGRSYKYMTEAINSECKMWGHKVNLAKQFASWATGGNLGILITNGKCETGACIPLGLDTPEYPARGTFSVGTGPTSPYCVKDDTKKTSISKSHSKSSEVTDPTETASGSLASEVDKVVEVVSDVIGDVLCLAGGVEPRKSSSSIEGSPARYPKYRTENTVCYKGLGSFSLGPPWNRRSVPEPETPDYINTQFYLYTRKSSERTVITTQPKVDLQGTDYQPNRKTFIIIHGFLNDGTLPWMRDMKEAILSKVDGNVILTNWGDGAKTGNYFQVVANTRIVGAEIARLLRHLEELGTPLSNVHLLGHSLGAHISSYAAKARPGIARITALDPAQPAFENFDHRIRIDASDAQFVDVIHTNAKPTVPFLGFGMIPPIGHVDFYLNGGADQPGCEKPKLQDIVSVSDLLKAPVSALAQLVVCSHDRAYEYMTEAIASDCKMWGHEMDTVKNIADLAIGNLFNFPSTHGKKCKPGACIPLGLDTPEYPARGSFSVKTGSSSPFCIKERSNDGQDLKELRSLGIIPDSKSPATGFSLGAGLTPVLRQGRHCCN